MRINPDVILIAEPWGGGGYNPRELADRGWASWNDHFRNSIKGRNPMNSDYGFIFGKTWDNKDLDYYKALMRGYTQMDSGHYRNPVQSVNYLESHDDLTLGDFIRIALGDVGEHEKVTREKVSKLTIQQLKIHKFAALNLFVSQGPIMLAQGQSWGRAKVIAETRVDNPRVGELDHNSYEKDDETNWLNWEEKAQNRELVDYYRGLIAIRSKYASLRNAKPGIRVFLDGDTELSFGFSVRTENEPECLVLMNGDVEQSAQFTLPVGKWSILADGQSAGLEIKWQAEKMLKVKPQSGLILVKE